MVSKNLSIRQSVCLSVCYKLWPQLSQDWQNKIGLKILIFHLNRIKNQLKTFFTFGCQSSFCKPVFPSKTANLWLNSFLDSHHLQGVWNLPHKFYLYLILDSFVWPTLEQNKFLVSPRKLIMCIANERLYSLLFIIFSGSSVKFNQLLSMKY